jgi:glutamyl-tRNA synthetase
VQSTRPADHDRALESLRAQDRVYPCFCSRTEVARAASAPHGPADDGPVYPGTCAGLDEATRSARAASRPPAWRFRCSPGVSEANDLLRGTVRQDIAAEVGDFVVRRNDGVASYQLAVVVDDAASGITHVLRGEDLLPSTPRQIQLAQALGLPSPRYAHVPLLLGPDGKRLAKRGGPPSLAELRRAGVPALRVVGLLAGWAGLGDGGPVAPPALVQGFSLERVPRQPITVDPGGVREALLG